MKQNSRSTQRSRILAALVEAHGNWVPLPQISACAAQYNARIFELRRLGFRIINRTKEVDGVRHSWFKLETQAVTKPTVSASPLVTTAALLTEPLSLFDTGRDSVR
jgi:hypothetical protein